MHAIVLGLTGRGDGDARMAAIRDNRVHHQQRNPRQSPHSHGGQCQHTVQQLIVLIGILIRILIRILIGSLIGILMPTAVALTCTSNTSTAFRLADFILLKSSLRAVQHQI
jgi:hypothetical protein